MRTKAIAIRDLLVDPERYIAYRGRRPVTLTKTEFEILYLILSGDGKIFTRSDIARSVWSDRRLHYPRSIDVHICNIRKKIGRLDGKNVIVVAKRVGYKLNPELAAPPASS